MFLTKYDNLKVTLHSLYFELDIHFVLLMCLFPKSIRLLGKNTQQGLYTILHFNILKQSKCNWNVIDILYEICVMELCFEVDLMIHGSIVVLIIYEHLVPSEYVT